MRKNLVKFARGTCHICGYPIDPEFDGYLKSSADYVTEKTSVCFCHWYCNMLKGNRPITQDLKDIARREIRLLMEERERKLGKPKAHRIADVESFLKRKRAEILGSGPKDAMRTGSPEGRD